MAALTTSQARASHRADAALTYPLAFDLGAVGYKPHVAGDMAWVAHALVNNPLHVFNANIFFPHGRTLIYSEANLLASAYVALYAAIAGFALWQSFGLKAGLYTVTYYTVPAVTVPPRARAASVSS